MNDFFSNLLHRHQSTCDLVKPRPLSRYESDGLESGRSSEESAIQTEFPEKPFQQYPQRATRRIPADPMIPQNDPPDMPRPSDRQFTGPQSLSAAPETVGPKYIGIERITPVATEFHNPINEEMPDGPTGHFPKAAHRAIEPGQMQPESLDEPGVQAFTLESDPDSYIQKALERLRESGTDPPLKGPSPDVKESRPHFREAGAGDQEKNPSMEETPHDPAKTATPTDERNRLSSETPHGEAPAQLDQDPDSDRLKPPFWVSRLAAQLRDQGLEAPPATQNEPDVNVTIGRIEVRAVPSEKTGPQRARKKFSGVMSLDQYLKQREQAGST